MAVENNNESDTGSSLDNPQIVGTTDSIEPDVWIFLPVKTVHRQNKYTNNTIPL